MARFAAFTAVFLILVLCDIFKISANPAHPHSGKNAETYDTNSTSDDIVKVSVSALILLAAIRVTTASGQGRPNEPTKEEIAQAYRSKSGGVGMYIPRHEWEHWRIKEIRGWKLHFKRISETWFPGVLTLKYEAVAKKNSSCAEYEITDTMPLRPNPQIRPILVVDSNGMRACR